MTPSKPSSHTAVNSARSSANASLVVQAGPSSPRSTDGPVSYEPGLLEALPAPLLAAGGLAAMGEGATSSGAVAPCGATAPASRHVFDSAAAGESHVPHVQLAPRVGGRASPAAG